MPAKQQTSKPASPRRALQKSPMATGSRHEHDHAACFDASISRAEQAFETRGLRLTELRRRVLEEIANSHKAIGAYELLERLQKKSGKRMAPISVYRALDALIEIELVHRIESRNAFVACHSAHAGVHNAQARHMFLVCDTCDVVEEIDASKVLDVVDATARGKGFQPGRTVVETTGRCADCVTLKP
jgi:Fur family transcriptional regulator, zinc uptake regulator